MRPQQSMAEQAYMMPILWMQHVTPVSSRIDGRRTTPTHLVSQDLVDVWLAP
jgi:hypothetical protein